jgi:hypothetical protein
VSESRHNIAFLFLCECHLIPLHTIGDYVNVAMQNRTTTLLARISSLWEDRSGKHAKLLWMYFPEDTKLGRLPHHGMNITTSLTH